MFVKPVTFTAHIIDKRQKHFQKDGSSDFALDLSKICDGAEKRTTIMVCQKFIASFCFRHHLGKLFSLI